MRQEQLNKLALSFIPGVGAKTTRLIVSYCGSIEKVLKAKKSQLLKIPGIGPKIANAIINNNALERAEQEAKNLEKHEIKFSFYLDKDYPQRLKVFDNTPIILYYKGHQIPTRKRSIAIVGTRTPSEYGSIMTEKIIKGLKAYDVSIVSGLAYGIDTIAHNYCVTNGMQTFGILGQGFPKIYPDQNRKLAFKMMTQGGVITEFPFGTKPDRENFPKRNRIIAAMSDATIVIESRRKGGSIITANYANDYFKDVFAVPGKIGDDRSEGCNKLIKQHKAALIETADDIAYVMGWDKEVCDSKQIQIPFDLDPIEEKIIAQLKTDDNHRLDQLHLSLKIPLTNLANVLLQLEFKGIIKSLPGKKYQLV